MVVSPSTGTSALGSVSVYGRSRRPAPAASTIPNMRWFEVTDIRGHIVDQKPAHWQVTVKIGFTLDD
jgi:hypothetical protein